MILSEICSKCSNIADVSGKVIILNVFAMGSKVGILTGWLPMAVLTAESYPTVIRCVCVCACACVYVCVWGSAEGTCLQK